jgi:cob(I)alamin adenosyltransferase
MAINLTRIYTRLGDDGKTHLGDRSRVPKLHPRIAAYGAVDELNSHIGLAQATCDVPDEPASRLRQIQGQLFDVGADLSVPPSTEGEKRLRITGDYVAWLERACDAVNETLDPLKSFVIPGGTPLAAHLHVCRTICRRAELLALGVEDANPEVLRYLNRLSDLLFVMARAANNGDDPLWEPGASFA